MSIMTQLEEVRNQICTNSGGVEDSVDVLTRLRENNIDTMVDFRINETLPMHS